MASLAPSYLIIGAGVFGASTALHLSQQKPAPTVILIDRAPYPCPIAASHDINKIVRSDYGDIFYCKLGLETLEKWRNDPLFKKWYHQSGLLKATDHAADLVDKISENYKKLGVDVGAELFKPENLKTKFGGIYADTDLSDVEHLLWNPSCGWAEAARALEETIAAAVENGVHYVTTSVARLIIENGSCAGITTEDGRTFIAEKTILSTGAYTAKLLAGSAPKQPDLQVGDRIVAAGVCEAAMDLTPEQIKKFNHVPAFVLDANKTQGKSFMQLIEKFTNSSTQGETMPPTPDGQLKFIRDIPFKNTIDHPASGQKFSVPRTDLQRSQWVSPSDIPQGIRDEISTVMKGIYGKEVHGLQPSTMRFCWDGITPDNNWFITPHPRCENLYIATAGSFHGWKFLPIIGKYVVQMLRGELSEEMEGRWRWDRKFEGVPNSLIPRREMRDL
ncbi:hypothetical protein ACLMJK_002619 [Lecanora helva]